MAITIVMMDQKKFTESQGRTYYAHLNPSTGRLDSWGVLINELPDFGEGGDE